MNNSLHLAKKYVRLFLRGHFLFREANRFVRFEEQLMFKGNYPAKWRLLTLLSLKYFFATRGFFSEIGERISLGYHLVLAGAYSVM